MKKKEIDLFNILIGVIIGCVIGYFLFTQIKANDKEDITDTSQEEIYGTVYTIQLGVSNNKDNLNTIIERLDILDIYYEIYEEGGKYYIFNSVFNKLSEAQNEKSILESYGFIVSIRSDYILDLSNNVNNNLDYDFYNEVIVNLLYSLNNEIITISEKYYSNPIDIELFSNITILMTIKNENIKKNYELNTLCLLLKKLK